MPFSRIRAKPERIREARERAGLTQEQAGTRVGVDGQSIYRYESGRQKPSPAALNMMAQVYGVTVDWLTGKSDEPTVPPAAPQDLRVGGAPASIPEKREITPEEAVENFRTIMEEPGLALSARRGSLTLEDMADIAGYIRDMRSRARGSADA